MAKEKICGIYCIENMINGKKYIGKAVDIYARWGRHKSLLRGGKHENEILQRAWNKNGENNFIFYIISVFEIEKLDEKEIYYIKDVHSHVTEWGYNISWGGKTPMLGRAMSEEQKRKISIAELGVPKGPCSQETKDKISEGNKGKIRSEEFKNNLSEKWKGEGNPNFGKPMPEERKQKMIETKRKIRENKPKKEKKNIQERKLELGFSSKYIGVSYSKNKKKWRSYVKTEEKQIHIGYFDTELEAVLAYNNYILNNSINKKLNIIQGDINNNES